MAKNIATKKASKKRPVSSRAYKKNLISNARQAGEQAQAGMSERREVRVMFMDEGRFGRISDTRLCWAPAGNRPLVASQVVREYIYAYVTLCPFDGSVEALVAPDVDADVMSVFLGEVSKRFADEHVVLIMDQAGWHKADRLKIPSNITLHWLPPYSPELNPVEHLWEELREKWFHNRVFSSIEEVEEQLIQALQHVMQLPLLVQSLALFAWMAN